MSTVLLAGAEWGTHAGDGATVFSGSISTAAARSGTYGYRGDFQFPVAGVVGTTYFLRVYFKPTSAPSASDDLISFHQSGGTRIVSLRYETNGTLTLRNLNGIQVGSASSQLTFNDWNMLELSVNVPVSGDGTVEARLGGVSFVSSTTTSVGNAAVSQFRTNEQTGSATNFDDIVIHDDQGGVNNSWPGPGRVLLARPFADSSVGSWRNGNNTGTTNLWDSIDNQPPGGVAAANETATTNIESASNNGFDTYRASCTSYNNLGIQADETILAVQAHAWHGEDISTGTKNGNLELTSNPNVATTTAFDYGTNAGPHGIFASLWTLSKTPVSETPTVTRANPISVSITKEDGTTRVACVAAMGAYVHVQEASGPDVVTGDFTADAVLKKTISATVTADAVLKRTESGTFTADALLTLHTESSFTANAILKATTSATFTADSVLKSTVAGSVTANSILRRVESGSITADSILKATIVGTFTADAVLEPVGAVTITDDFTADAILKRIESASVTADSILRKSVTTTFTADAYLLAVVSASITADAVLRKTITASLSADAVLRKAIEQTFVADAALRVVVSGSATADAVLLKTITTSVTADAFLKLAPIWVSPADTASHSSTPVLVFKSPVSANSQYFQLQLDKANTFDSGDLVTYDSEVDQAGWEYWNGSAWTALPSTGLPAAASGNEVRLTVPMALTEGTWYRRVRGSI